MIDFRDSLIEYLTKEKQYCDEEIARHQMLSRQEKLSEGLVICDAVVVAQPDNKICRFHFNDNNTKIRIGDKVTINRADGSSVPSRDFMVVDVAVDHMDVERNGMVICADCKWDIEICEMSMFDNYISVLQSIDEYASGSFFLEQLAGLQQPVVSSFGGNNQYAEQLAEACSGQFNSAQNNALHNAIKCPSIRLIQGPPGTGKTRVLSAIATIMSMSGMETAVVAKTHQAVNNALNAIKRRNPDLNVIKIGQAIRTEGLDANILTFEKYQNYIDWRKKQKRNKKSVADIVGMTLQASAVNMCLRNTGFKPQIVLIDEASQIPLAEAAIVGASGAGSIIIIGDDRQMPPIFAEQLENDPLSVSIFQHIAKLHPNAKDVLDITYRMNDEICDCVSRNFYIPSINLVSAPSVGQRRLAVDVSNVSDNRIKDILGKDDSIFSMDVSQGLHEEHNDEEAVFAVEVAVAAMQHIKPSDIAIVTPFRKQVNAIRQAFKKITNTTDYPLVDTVERLQGQDVEFIILSFAVTDPTYYGKVKGFILNRNRLNVMISRAKSKVLILKSKIINLGI